MSESSPETATPVYSVVIVHYNNPAYLAECLASVFACSFDAPFEVIVVDNASTEGDVHSVLTHFPAVRLLQLDRNVGFAAGNNRALALARGAYLVLLNNDVTVDPHFGDGLQDFFANDPQLAVVQPKILLQNDPTRINNCGLVVQYFGFAWDLGYGQPSSVFAKPFPIGAFSGAAAIVRKRALDEVGMFDNAYFMYHEDVDLSLRLRRAGYRLQCVPAMAAYHRYSFKRHSGRYYALERNRLLTVLKNYPGRALLLIALPFLLFECGMILFSLLDGWFGKKMHAYADVLCQIPAVLRFRKNAVVRISAQQFFRFTVGPLTFSALPQRFVRGLLNPFLASSWFVIRKLIA